MIYIYKYKIDQIPQSLLNIYIYLCYDRGNEDKCYVYVYVYVFCAVLCLCVFTFLCIVLLKQMLHLFLKLVYICIDFGDSIIKMVIMVEVSLTGLTHPHFGLVPRQGLKFYRYMA